MLFAYFGPETMMPVASVIAAGVGVVMMFGRNIVGFGRSLAEWSPAASTAAIRESTVATTLPQFC